VADAGALVVRAARRGRRVIPIFGRPLGFYLFTLPAWQILSRLAADAQRDFLRDCRSVSAGFRRHARAHRRSAALSGLLPWRGVSIARAFLLFVVAMRVYVGRFELLFDHHTIFDGVTYTDAHVTIPACWCAALPLER
jgi:uncharacterized membrane protein (UPF0182 family)